MSHIFFNPNKQYKLYMGRDKSNMYLLYTGSHRHVTYLFDIAKNANLFQLSCTNISNNIHLQPADSSSGFNFVCSSYFSKCTRTASSALNRK